MALFTASIASGSNGNCYYIGTHEDAVLIDAGISCRETERRMKRIGLNIKNVRAVIISHEHSDHINGVASLAKKYTLPIYVTAATAHGGRLNIALHHRVPFQTDVPITVGKLEILPFRKHHDAADPHSFVISGNGVSIGVFTDIGTVCDQLKHHFQSCHAAFLESNYDELMLENGPYNAFLKNRIRSGKGHLSNIQALKLFNECRNKHLSHLFLSHLSRENNDPQLALNMFQAHADNVQIIHASRYQETMVYQIAGSQQPHSQAAHEQRGRNPQLQLL